MSYFQGDPYQTAHIGQQFRMVLRCLMARLRLRVALPWKHSITSPIWTRRSQLSIGRLTASILGGTSSTVWVRSECLILELRKLAMGHMPVATYESPRGLRRRKTARRLLSKVEETDVRKGIQSLTMSENRLDSCDGDYPLSWSV